MAKKYKKVSVILPFYNSRKFLRRSIESVLKQTYKNLEIILIDDCSNDGSGKIAKDYLKIDQRILLLKTSKQSATPSIPRNLGIEKSTGEYISFIDSDDYWKPNKIQFQMDNIKGYDLCSSACDYVSDDLKNKSGFFLNFIRLFLQKFFLDKIKNKGFFWFYIYNPVIISTVLIKKKLLKKKLIFHSDPTIREDLYLWIELFRSKNIKFIFLPLVLATITRNKKSLTSNKLEEFSKIIKTLTSDIIMIKDYKYLNYIIAGISLRSLKFFLINNFFILKKNIKILFLIVSIIYFTIFYSPLFWYLGDPFLKFDEIKINKKSNIVIYSGHKKFSNFSITFKNRYNDVKKIIANQNINKIYLVGSADEFSILKILEKLLIYEKFKKDKIVFVFNEFNNNKESLSMLNDLMKKDNISNVILSTSPYSTSFNSYLWNKYMSLNVLVWKSEEWPTKNNFFEYAKNKKIITYQYFLFLKKYLNL